MEYINVKHTFDPVYDENSKVLILGSFPSVKSRENHFYYGHPQNRFWKVLAAVLESAIPETIEEKKQLLLENHIALWDVIESCSISGSSDSSIRNVVPNDFTMLLQNTKIKKIGGNGGKAFELYQRYALKKTGIEMIKLPSTSPANAACSMEQLLKEYGNFIKGRHDYGK